MTHQLPKTHYEAIMDYIAKLPKEKTRLKAGLVADAGNDPTYEEYYKAVTHLFKEPDNQSPAFLSYMNIYYHLYHMKKSHDKIYYITPALSAKLALTTVDVDSCFIRSPFREIYIQIDPNLFSIKDQEGALNPVTGFYVNLRDLETHKQLRVMACSLKKPSPERSFNETTFYFRLELYPGKVRDQVKKYLENKIKNDTEYLNKFGGIRNIDYFEDFAYFILNSLLYITSKNPDLSNYNPINVKSKLQGLKSSAKKRKLEQKASKVSSYRIIVVGDNIKNNANDFEAIQDRRCGKLTVRVLVSGHWRAQWYGNDKDRHTEIIWIEPYTKGPELADVINSRFVVK